ncbi:hypothetical protein C4552_01490 [Candidatus Parcubacteria bacterium]|nr:MAG: hypothetical protein C4552_01490 [Candidatus Parcubacteria bacterium]
MPIAVILSAAVLVSASIASEWTLPGNPLYRIKTGVNERVQAALALSSSADAGLQTTFAERRLQEISELSAKGEGNTEAAAEAYARYEAHAYRAAAHAAQFRASGDIEAAADIEARLQSLVHIDTGTEASAQAQGSAAVELGL